ncbi:MAG: YbeD family protein [Gammaproteobacteria bacterium]
MSAELLEFPCEFPLKIMGRKTTGFRETVLSLVEPHTGTIAATQVRERDSRDGNFVALTLVVHAQSQAQLDAIYTALSAHDQVLMVL